MWGQKARLVRRREKSKSGRTEENKNKWTGDKGNNYFII